MQQVHRSEVIKDICEGQYHSALRESALIVVYDAELSNTCAVVGREDARHARVLVPVGQAGGRHQ